MNKNLDERYMVHDELLYELYNLKLDTIKYQIISGQPYLVNIVKTKSFEIGFRVKMSELLDERIPSDTYLNEINFGKYHKDEFFFDTNETYIEKYGKYLCLSNLEKYLLNVLFDKFLEKSYYPISISLMEIETKYRDMCLSRRNIVLNNDTFNRYILILNELANKKVYIKTKGNFRKSSYGVNNKECFQSLLSIKSHYKISSNNIGISFSLGMLGNIIKNCKRYSAIAPAIAFKVNFSQVKINLAAMYLSRIIFIERWNLKNKHFNREYIELNVDELVSFVTDPLNKNKSNSKRYRNSIEKIAIKILATMKRESNIYNFEELYHKQLLSKEDAEREYNFQLLDEYWGEKTEKSEVTKEIRILVNEPNSTYGYDALHAVNE